LHADVVVQWSDGEIVKISLWPSGGHTGNKMEECFETVWSRKKPPRSAARNSSCVQTRMTKPVRARATYHGGNEPPSVPVAGMTGTCDMGVTRDPDPVQGSRLLVLGNDEFLPGEAWEGAQAERHPRYACLAVGDQQTSL
jgi:hypothetical protein